MRTREIANKEIDFIATNAQTKHYYQVTETMNDPDTRKRELEPLCMIRDNYEKIVLARHCDSPVTQQGIRIVNLTDFLLDEDPCSSRACRAGARF